jgi:hypothetical protein
MSARTGRITLLLGGLLVASPGLAASYDFAPAPQTDLNRVYRVDRLTGEVTSCQYGLQEGTVGATLCFGAGEGAGPQAPGEYALVPSRHVREAGIFRVNGRTGEMSICYVLEEVVVCTPQGGPPAPSAGRAPGVQPAQRPQ